MVMVGKKIIRAEVPPQQEEQRGRAFVRLYAARWAPVAVAALGRPLVTTDGDYITLAQAAELAGYASKSSLQTAARTGRLQTRRIGNQLVTTRAWLEQYLEEREPQTSARQAVTDTGGDIVSWTGRAPRLEHGRPVE